jgi:uncharacterized membrane protein YqaE (UPF0057 family)
MQELRKSMGCFRAVLCIVFPPLAVIDRGCGTVLVVLVLTMAAWVPGVIAALLINFVAAERRRY